jgi:preprotein translocase subunit YajC
MNLNGLTTVLADAAPATSSGGTTGAPPSWTSAVPLLLMMVIMVVVLFGPQRKQKKQLEALMKSLKPGDKILTSSGIVGTVVSVKDKTAAIRSAETKLEILKSAITEITERSSDTASSES